MKVRFPSLGDWFMGQLHLYLKSLVLKLLGQPFLSSFCERNLSTYSFIYSINRNKMNLQCAEDLVFVYINL